MPRRPERTAKRTPKRIKSSKLIYRGRIISVRRDRITEPGGVDVTRDVVIHAGSVVILPVFPDGRILLVRQYRHAAGRALWELCAGRKERRESWLETAQRELREETGFRARRLRRLLAFYPSPGILTERMVLYVATGMSHDPATPDTDERITTRLFSLPELLRWIRRGRIMDAKSIAGILFYAQLHRR